MTSVTSTKGTSTGPSKPWVSVEMPATRATVTRTAAPAMDNRCRRVMASLWGAGRAAEQGGEAALTLGPAAQAVLPAAAASGGLAGADESSRSTG